MCVLGITALYALTMLWWKWILSWGGAERLEGWQSFWLIDWFAAAWSAEQIRLYAWLMLGVETIVYIFLIFTECS